jgi:hypothetical protein
VNVKKDRLLIAILIGIGIIVLLALALFFLRQGGQEYGAEDAPDGVVRNYLLAVEKRDYERAYSYLAEGEAKPGLDAFKRAFLTPQLDTRSAAVQIGRVEEIGEDAIVSLILMHNAPGPFADSWREETNAALQRDGQGAWKIISLAYPYWDFSWYNPQVVPKAP